MSGQTGKCHGECVSGYSLTGLGDFGVLQPRRDLSIEFGLDTMHDLIEDGTYLDALISTRLIIKSSVRHCERISVPEKYLLKLDRIRHGNVSWIRD